jgi:hypothetical protein
MHLGPKFFVAWFTAQAFVAMGGLRRIRHLACLAREHWVLWLMNSPPLLIFVSALDIFLMAAAHFGHREILQTLMWVARGSSGVLGVTAIVSGILTRRVHPYLIAAFAATVTAGLGALAAANALMIASLIILQGYELELYRNWTSFDPEYLAKARAKNQSLLWRRRASKGRGDAAAPPIGTPTDDSTVRVAFARCGGAMTAAALYCLSDGLLSLPSGAWSQYPQGNNAIPLICVVLIYMMWAAALLGWTVAPRIFQPLHKRLVTLSIGSGAVQGSEG